ncbi:MAG: GNAT family N-acetyltransferase [Pseudomonadales bacterium]|nr:GNAT family N-acetyltransferase [Pseudomonadales bacterium]NIX09672.1 GNAT family N-acetyltransferase [Pseudomonadales bacterium]
MTSGAKDDVPRPFRITDVRVYRPYPDEVPWDLLDDRAAVDPSGDEVQIRIAKLGDDLVGVYVAEPLDPLTFRIVDLVVAERWRGRGIGRWLLGHAIGLAESRGAREVQVSDPSPRRFFASIGFVDAGDAMRFLITPE